MLDEFLSHLASTGLISRDSKVLVGYSGGADSTCLLHLLATSGFDVVGAHLHHGQRPEADDEKRRCEAFCDELNVPFVSGQVDIPTMASELGIGYEEAGREARYGFFTQAAYQTGCDLIATAHTRNDLAETIILNLTRGSGISGVSGIPSRRGAIVRPLLTFSREATRNYCEKRDFWFHDDPSNSDVNFSRARIRHRVLPELRSINPMVDLALSKFANIAQDEDRFLNGMAAAALEKAEIPLNGELKFLTEDVEVAFSKASLFELPPVLFRRGIRLAVEAIGASLTFDQTVIIEKSAVGTGSGSITAEGGDVVVEWNGDSIVVRSLAPTTPFRYGLTLPGETVSDEFGWKFTAFREPFNGVFPTRSSNSTTVDSAKVQGTLYFRTAGNGDKMSPLGFEGHRKIADLLSEFGLTLAARSRLPIVCDMVGPIWVPGVCLDDRAKPDHNTSHSIRISFEALNSK